MAISTYGITLKWGTSATTLTKKVDIKDFSDLGGAAEMLDATTLSDPAYKYISGIQANDAIEFTANYTKADYEAVVADANKPLFYALEFGLNGSEGVFEWQGEHTAWVVGAGVNSVTEMKISVAPSTKPTLKTV